MIEWILALFALLSLYKEINFFLIKRRVKGDFKVNKLMEPFFYKRGKRGVLLIHGFSSSPGEMKELGKYLADQRFSVHSPLLTGHGTTPERMSVSKWYQWIDSVKQGIDMLAEHCSEIWLVGNSLGGNIAIILANYDKKIKGIVCLGSPVYYPRRYKFARVIFPLMNRIKLMQKKNIKHKKRVVRRKKKYSYKQIPLRSLPHLIKIIKLSKKEVFNVKKPILIMQAKPDFYVAESSARFIFDNVKTDKKRLIWIKDSYHVLLDDIHRKKVFNRIGKFIK